LLRGRHRTSRDLGPRPDPPARGGAAGPAHAPAARTAGPVQPGGRSLARAESVLGPQVEAALGDRRFQLADGQRPGRASQFAGWVRALVIAVACELPAQRGLALGPHFATSVWRVVSGEGVWISLRTVQRMLGPRI